MNRLKNTTPEGWVKAIAQNKLALCLSVAGLGGLFYLAVAILNPVVQRTARMFNCIADPVGCVIDTAKSTGRKLIGVGEENEPLDKPPAVHNPGDPIPAGSYINPAMLSSADSLYQACIDSENKTESQCDKARDAFIRGSVVTVD